MSALKSLRIAFAAALLVTGLPFVAEGQNKVSSPDVTKGQAELEYRGSIDNDDLLSRDGAHAQKAVVNYGFTDRFRVEGKGAWTGLRNRIDLTGAELSGRYQIFKDKEAPIRLSVQANYKFALSEGRPDRIEATVLAAKDIGKFTHITNVNFENEIGANARGATGFNFGVKTKYRMHPRFEPGAEVYADFGKWRTPDTVAPSKILAGPAVTGKLSKNIRYDVGYLFGADKNWPRGRLRAVITYSLKFRK